MTLDPTRQLPGAVVTANEALFDAMVRHQIHLLRVAGSIRNDVLDLLNATEADLARRIRGTALQGGPTPGNFLRAKRLITAIRLIRNAAWGEIDDALRLTFNDLVLAEARFADVAIRTSSPVLIDSTIPSVAQLKALVTTSPFEGRILSSWAQKLRVDDLARIEAQIKIGMVQGEGNAVIAQRVVGTARARGTDGVLQITRRQATGVVRTATNHFSNQARREFFLENSDLVTEELYVATLDGRTTPRCRSLDGQRFPVGEGPIPPVHWMCRSLRVAVFDGEALGRRPSKPVTERQLLREFSARNKLGVVPTKRINLPRGTKGNFDQFSRKRIREITGTVPAKVMYQEWMKTQTTEFQNDTLGVTNAKLFRGGKPLTQFVDRAGNELTLKQLAQADADAFRSVGLDPEDFK